jgi:hypothetical protein
MSGITREQALEIANDRRVALADLRRSVRDGVLTLGDVLLPVHPLVVSIDLVDVVRWQYRDRWAGCAALERLGRRAVEERVNLLMRAGRASETSRMWVAQNGGHSKPAWAAKRAMAGLGV